MQNKIYNKSIIRELLSSKARFASILAIIFLGVAFYAGIKSTGPDMKESINNFYSTQNLMDSKVVSTLGLTEKDLGLLKDNDKILDYYGSHSIDANLTNINSVVRFMEYNPKEAKMNNLVVLQGRLPENSGEIALDQKALETDKNLKIGDKYVVESDKDTMKSFKEKTFKIVGFVKSPMYVEKTSRGTTSIGKGSIDYFGVLNSSDISMDVYTEVYVRFKNVQGINSYNDDYKSVMEENNKYLKSLFSKRSVERIDEIKLDAQKELDKADKEIKDGETKLSNAQKEIEDGKQKLKDGKKQYEQGRKDYNKKIKDGESSLLKGEKQIEEGQRELDTQRSKIGEGEKQLSSAKIQIDKARAEFTSQGINPDEFTTDMEPLASAIAQYREGKVKYEKQLEIFNSGKLQIENAQKKLDNAKSELPKGRKELEKGREQGILELNKAKKQLEDSEKKLINGEKEINENKEKLLDGKVKLEEEKEKLKDVDKGKYYFFDRNDNTGYSSLKDSIKSLDNIAKVFPVFFFLLAVLICLTTMTRMVEENRTEIGTFKALGYSNLEISKKYIVYAALASILGSVLGILLGSNLFPYVISNAYGGLFDLPKLTINYYPAYIIQSVALSTICTVGAALFVLKAQLKDNACNLMKAKAPKIGKKILLERITPLWKRFNFNHKVTLRNLFRYKQRMIMSVFGIAGCMALLIVGFSLQKSNTVVLDKQFKGIWNYQAMVIFNEDFKENDTKEYNEALKGIKEYQSSINIHQEAVTFSKEDVNKQDVTMYVPQDAESLNKFVSLRDMASENGYKLTDNGAIINEKLAKLLKASVGDMITMKDKDDNSYSVKVEKIAENYLGHFIYMSPTYYEKIFKEKPIYNAELLKLNANKESEQRISAKLMDLEKVINVTLTSKIADSSADSAGNLNLIMLVIIISSGSLAFIVLYNLTNINVSERIRELSTIKVLGFFDKEVTMYILRENIILTLLGVVAGSFMGKILYSFIINTAETDNMMMLPNVYMSSHIYSGIITILFSLLVIVMMHIKLRNINMIDALKSVE